MSFVEFAVIGQIGADRRLCIEQALAGRGPKPCQDFAASSVQVGCFHSVSRLPLTEPVIGKLPEFGRLLFVSHIRLVLLPLFG